MWVLILKFWLKKIYSPKRSDADWIVFIPGNGDKQLLGSYNFFSDLQSYLPSNQIGFASWALRGFGGAPGKPHPSDLEKDQLALINYLEQTKEVSISNIHIIGFSFGSDLALQLAGNLSAKGQAPASVVLLSTKGLTVPKWKMRGDHWYSRFLHFMPKTFRKRSQFSFYHGCSGRKVLIQYFVHCQDMFYCFTMWYFSCSLHSRIT